MIFCLDLQLFCQTWLNSWLFFRIEYFFVMKMLAAKKGDGMCHCFDQMFFVQSYFLGRIFKQHKQFLGDFIVNFSRNLFASIVLNCLLNDVWSHTLEKVIYWKLLCFTKVENVQEEGKTKKSYSFEMLASELDFTWANLN